MKPIRHFAAALPVIALLLLVCSPAHAEDKKPGKLSVGVSEVEVTPAVTEKMASLGAGKKNSLMRAVQAMDTQISAQLFNTGKVDVVARKDAARILKDQDFQRVFSENPVKAFKMAKTDYVLTVEFNDFQDVEETLKAEGGLILAKKRTLRITAGVKIWDAETFKIKAIENVPVSLTKGARQQFQAGADDKQFDELIGEAGTLLASAVAQRVTDVLYPAKVLQKLDKFVIINRGDGTDIAAGQIWTAMAVGEAITDPDTGETIVPEFPVGKVKIQSVTPKFSRGEIIEDAGIVAGAILRREAPVAPPGTPAPAPANGN